MSNSTFTTTPCGTYITNISQSDTHARYMKVLLKLCESNKEVIENYSKVGTQKFHAWVYDNETKEIIDTYNDTQNWNMAKTYSHIKKLLNVSEMVYKEFDTIPQKIQKLIDYTKAVYDEDDVVYRSLNFLDEYGYCLQRAYAKHRSNPDRFKLKFGTIVWKFKDGRADWNTEMDDERDGEIIGELIRKVVVLSKFKSRRLPAKVVKNIIGWYNTPKEVATALYHKLGYK